MTSIKTSNIQPGKPILLRAIFILNALLVIAGFVFYFVFATKASNGESTLGIAPSTLLIMAFIYLAIFAGIVASILKKQIWIVRGLLLCTLICSILIVLAPIGILIATISLGLSFSKPVTNYFA
ncbi:MAG: hypothetical protein P8P74_13825 [Crocinitomicaceae bacterium]|nr:hypothetical protein [Crocinitomicaceae bacterium]